MVVHCPACDADHTIELPQSFRCPVCGAYAANISRGHEIQVVAMELV